jgi:hypothetical protein
MVTSPAESSSTRAVPPAGSAASTAASRSPWYAYERLTPDGDTSSVRRMRAS